MEKNCTGITGETFYNGSNTIIFKAFDKDRAKEMVEIFKKADAGKVQETDLTRKEVLKKVYSEDAHKAIKAELEAIYEEEKKEKEFKEALSDRRKFEAYVRNIIINK